MTPETALWIMGGALLPTLGWAISLTWKIRSIKEDTKDILERLDQTNEALQTSHRDMIDAVKGMTRAVKALTHYITWMAKEQSGKNPPPPVDVDGE